MTTQTVIITGGATGLGYAIAEAFLHNQANVILNGRTFSKLETSNSKFRTILRCSSRSGSLNRA
jgi:short-subunit dehydrogenase involved in D-alanine esterification of teichoic acids